MIPLITHGIVDFYSIDEWLRDRADTPLKVLSNDLVAQQQRQPVLQLLYIELLTAQNNYKKSPLQKQAGLLRIKIADCLLLSKTQFELKHIGWNFFFAKGVLFAFVRIIICSWLYGCIINGKTDSFITHRDTERSGVCACSCERIKREQIKSLDVFMRRLFGWNKCGLID